MQKFAIAALLLVSGTVAAQQIYRSFDEDGNITFSDQPSPGAEQIKVEPVQSFTPPAMPARKPAASLTDAAAAEGPAGYDKFAIVAPSDDDTIRNNEGNVDVAVTIQPSLRSDHSLRVLLDGDPLGEMSGPYVRLENVDRGTHTVTAEVLDTSGTVVAVTDPVKFHLHRESLIINRQQGQGIN